MEHIRKTDNTMQSQPLMEQSIPGRCGLCDSTNSQLRAQHQLYIAIKDDLDTLEAHLRLYWFIQDPKATYTREEAVVGIVRWAAKMQAEWKDCPNPRFDAPIIWWLAYDQVHQQH